MQILRRFTESFNVLMETISNNLRVIDMERYREFRFEMIQTLTSLII